MEYVNVTNAVTGIALVTMAVCLVKVSAGDIGTNRFFYLLLLMGLGVGLYLWRSGTAADFLTTVFSTGK